MGYEVKDALLKKTLDLPATATHEESDAIEISGDSREDFVADCEVEVDAPVLDGTELPAAATMIYDLEESDDDTTYNVVHHDIITQTGAASVGGAVAANWQGRLPVAAKRYLRLKATGVGNGDCSGSEATVRLLF